MQEETEMQRKGEQQEIKKTKNDDKNNKKRNRLPLPELRSKESKDSKESQRSRSPVQGGRKGQSDISPGSPIFSHGKERGGQKSKSLKYIPENIY